MEIVEWQGFGGGYYKNLKKKFKSYKISVESKIVK